MDLKKENKESMELGGWRDRSRDWMNIIKVHYIRFFNNK